MAENKKIIFEGVDKGVSAFYDKIQRRATEANNSIIRDAKKHSDSLKEQLRFMEDSIKAIEKQNTLYEKQQRLLTQGAQKRAMSGANTQAQRDEISAQYSKKFAGLQTDVTSDKAIVTTLKQMLEVSKEQLRMDTSQDSAKKQEKADINDRWDAQRSLWEQEVKEDKEGVRTRISRARKSDFAGMTQDQRDKLNYQRTIVGEGEEKRQGVFKDVLAANLVTEGIKGAIGAIGNIGSGLAGMQDESQFMGALYGGAVGMIPGMAGLSSAVQQAKDREESAKKDREIASLRTRMSTGGTVGAATDLGLTAAESNEYASQIARAQGSGRGLGGQVRNLTGLKYGYGLDDSDIMAQLSTGRMTGTGGGQNIANMIQAMQQSGAIKGGDFSRLSEMLGTQDAIAREASNTQIAPDSNMITGLVSQFEQIGGAFGGERASQRIGTINQSLMNPGDDFNQAQNFAALAQLDPNASYVDMLKMQEKGVTQEGFLGQRLKQMQGQYGGGDNMTLAISKSLGLGMEDSELLMQSFEADPTRFDKMSFDGAGGISDMLQGRKKEMGTSGVSRFEQQAAQIEEAFAEGASTGVITAATIAGKKFSSEVMWAFEKALGSSFKDGVDAQPKGNGLHGQ